MWERLENREIRRRSLAAPFGTRPRPDLPPGTDLIPTIKHIVVLMQENHSYDNYLGTLTGRGDGFPLRPDGTPDVVNVLPNGQSVRARHFTATQQPHGDPTQAWRASHTQYAGGACDGFATSVFEGVKDADPTIPLGYWTEDELPYYHALAKTFPLADRWFCSCLGPTFPNRRFLISGTAHGLIDDLPWDIIDYPAAGTIFDALSSNGISWVNYHSVHPASVVFRRLAGTGGLRVLRRLAQVGRWLPGVTNAVRGNKSFTADLYPLGFARAVRHLAPVQRFFADAASGKLPAVSLVDPDFGAYSEENPQDITAGEAFSAAVINAVMHGPGWPHTLLIWTYDEHGGYYDHVPPPEAVPPDDIPAHNWQLDLPAWLRSLVRGVPWLRDELARLEDVDDGTRQFDRLGFRVPAVIVSPYARPDFVDSTVYDHTSILRLIEEKWNLAPLTARDAAATPPLAALDLDGEPAFLKPPVLPASAGGEFRP
jgi:phospholipase C